MSRIQTEIEKALAAIPADLEARYNNLSDIIKETEQELFERKVLHSAQIELIDSSFVSWSNGKEGWRLYYFQRGYMSKIPLIQAALHERIEAIQHLPALILKLAEMGVKIR